MEPEEILSLTRNGDAIPPDQIFRMCKLVNQIFVQEATVMSLQTPIAICGDIHGQFFDLIKIFEIAKTPKDTQFLFLGDYVDRGDFSVETILLLFAYKIKYPRQIYMLRGNHESPQLNQTYGFYDEVIKKYGEPKVWSTINEVFNMLPYAAVIDNSIFCIHGGLSPEMLVVERLALEDRNKDIPKDGILCDTVWSDPEDAIHTWGVSKRGAGYLFGPTPADEFCQNNSIQLIVRAHQLAFKGHMWHFLNSEQEHLTDIPPNTPFPSKVLTTWSAPNYCGEGNIATVTTVTPQHAMKFQNFEHTEVDQKLLDTGAPAYFTT